MELFEENRQERERRVHLSSHTGLVQVLPGHPGALARTFTSLPWTLFTSLLTQGLSFFVLMHIVSSFGICQDIPWQILEADRVAYSTESQRKPKKNPTNRHGHCIGNHLLRETRVATKHKSIKPVSLPPLLLYRTHRAAMAAALPSARYLAVPPRRRAS